MYTVNIQKGGAMIDDVRRAVETWETDVDPASNLDRIAETNVLGKRSRRRSDDVLGRIIRPRFVEPGPDVIPALRLLLDDPIPFREACYYETSRAEQLLAAFAEGPVYDCYAAGRLGFTIDEAVEWLGSLTGEGRVPEWTENVRTKVARGLLAALRDFGVLRGAVRKEFNPPRMSVRGFSYVAFREHQQGASARSLVEGSIWRRWLLDSQQVESMLFSLDRLSVIGYAKAGSAVRVDWWADDLEGVIRATA